MKTIWITTCHKCEAKHCVITGRDHTGVMRVECNSCEYTWATYHLYVAEYKAWSSGVGPFPQEVQIPDDCLGINPEYPGSDAMEQELNELIELVRKEERKKLTADLYEACEKETTGLTLSFAAEKMLDLLWDRVRAEGEEDEISG